MNKLVYIMPLLLIPVGIAWALTNDSIELKCGPQYWNCVVFINREPNTAAEVCFMKQGDEQVCILERYGGVLAIVIRTNNTVYDYAVQWQPNGQQINWHKQFYINDSGYYCKMNIFSNGTMRCLQEDPSFDSID